MLTKLTQNKIIAWKSIPIPGKSAQDIMLPHLDRNKIIVPQEYKRAGVMILMFKKKEAWSFVLIQRTHHPKDKHAGQISLPGGQLEDCDKNNIIQCAIRETTEEVGIPQDQIQYIASLTPIYVPVSGFMVYPQVGLFEGDISLFSKQDNEVEKLIWTSISQLMDDDIIKHKTIIAGKRTISNVPYFDIDNHVVWGATAMILSEFKVWID